MNTKEIKNLRKIIGEKYAEVDNYDLTCESRVMVTEAASSRASQNRHHVTSFDIYEFDRQDLTDVIHNLRECVEAYGPFAYFTVTVDPFIKEPRLEIKYRRSETDEEVTRRLNALEQVSSSYRLQRKEERERKEIAERKELDRLLKKYGNP